jgi:branched-chain amino acid aminotransferase
MVYFYNNQICDSLCLDVNNLGLLRGYAAFEYLRTYNQQPFCLQAHLHRFLFSIRHMGLVCPYSLQTLTQITLDLIAKHGDDCGVKWYATAFNSADGLRHNHRCELFAFTLPMTPPPQEHYLKGIDTATLIEKRPLPQAKTTAYFTATQYLSAKPDLQELIYLDHEGTVLEAATSNLFLVKNKILYTASAQVLHGITREVVLNLAQDRFEVSFQKINYSDLPSFDEIFITATNKEIMPVKKVDTLHFTPGPITAELSRAFASIKNSNIDYIPPLYQADLT